MRFFGQNKGAIEVLIAANILVFMITLMNPEFVFKMLGLRPVDVVFKPWTILSNMFVHSGFSHIIFNMIALFFFGLHLERIIGEKEFLKVYFVGGLFASLAYIFTSLVFGLPSPLKYAVGASGAVFAVMGVLVVLRPKLTILVNFIFPMPLYIWAGLYTLMAVFSMGSAYGNIAHNAHLGGLIAGLIFGNYYKKRIAETYYQPPTHGYRFY